MDQHLYDRANEWCSEHCSDLSSLEYEAKVLEVAAELAQLDTTSKEPEFVSIYVVKPASWAFTLFYDDPSNLYYHSKDNGDAELARIKAWRNICERTGWRISDCENPDFTQEPTTREYKLTRWV